VGDCYGVDGQLTAVGELVVGDLSDENAVFVPIEQGVDERALVDAVLVDVEHAGVGTRFEQVTFTELRGRASGLVSS